MEYQFDLYGEVKVFFVFLLCAVGMCIVFDMMRGIRRSLSVNFFFTAVLDLLFWIAAMILVTICMIRMDYIKIRFFEWLAMVIGCILYFFTISRWILLLFEWIFQCILKIIYFILKILLTPIHFLYKISLVPFLFLKKRKIRKKQIKDSVKNGR